MMQKSYIYLFFIFFLLNLNFAYAEFPKYEPLEVLPYITNSDGGTKVDVTSYIPGLIQLTIALAGVLAVIMLIYAGFQYITSDGFGKTSDAKDKIRNALFGLLLAIGAYSILFTLNPKLVDLNLDIKKVPPPVATTTPPDPNVVTNTGCSGCVYVTKADFNQKPPGSGCATTLPERKCQVNQALASKLRDLGLSLVFTSVGNNWQVTEMFPPTVRHKESCHMTTGTCVDASLYNPQNSQILKIFLQKIIEKVGSNFIYEVPNATRLKELQNDPVLKDYKSYFINTGALEHAHIRL